MRDSKRERLISKGWKLGSADELLGLTSEEAAYIEIKLRLGAGLRKARETKGLTQVELARLIQSSQSRVAKMEASDPTVSLDLLIRSLLALGGSTEDLAQMIKPPRRQSA